MRVIKVLFTIVIFSTALFCSCKKEEPKKKKTEYSSERIQGTWIWSYSKYRDCAGCFYEKLVHTHNPNITRKLIITESRLELYENDSIIRSLKLNVTGNTINESDSGTVTIRIGEEYYWIMKYDSLRIATNFWPIMEHRYEEWLSNVFVNEDADDLCPSLEEAQGYYVGTTRFFDKYNKKVGSDWISLDTTYIDSFLVENISYRKTCAVRIIDNGEYIMDRNGKFQFLSDYSPSISISNNELYFYDRAPSDRTTGEVVWWKSFEGIKQ